MTPETYRSKLANWLARHPVQTPPASLREGYTREVMARVERVAGTSGFRPRVWAAAAAAALACAGIVLALVSQPPSRLALAIARDADMLSAVGESPALPPADVADVAEELRMTDRLMLATSLPTEDDAAWVQGTLQLLDDLESEPSDQTVDESVAQDDESLEEELRRLDEADLGNA